MSKSKFVIEKNVPLPVRNTIPDFPLEEMQVGDSFVVTVTTDRERSSVRQRLSRYQVRNRPIRFSTISLNPRTVRVFRVKDYEQA